MRIAQKEFYEKGEKGVVEKAIVRQALIEDEIWEREGWEQDQIEAAVAVFGILDHEEVKKLFGVFE
eukprot:CAMPEP_0202957982 /NCGR_PEP_ID=MMETSP1396-20130829/2332_1 /ASSEMBLY_ACC=CAM_ASM_000872 /TAXON_ID= /ORGANISM="Pseudokeronopsis sp., Strain Brazil" /LENGTH=65 /DNA_ID=CAMNT_0049675747 /DNA_START=564 /DNA_END=761 /DNA_ORIENTATION=+